MQTIPRFLYSLPFDPTKLWYTRNIFVKTKWLQHFIDNTYNWRICTVQFCLWWAALVHSSKPFSWNWCTYGRVQCPHLQSSLL